MFKKGDIFIYCGLMFVFFSLGTLISNMPDIKAGKVEIYVNNKLKEVHKLSDERKEIFVPTDIGGVDVVLRNKGVEVTSSNSPRKLVMKQGFISKAGQTLIGVPDKILIKIVGQNNDDLDSYIR